jgi:hypothetical protein
MNADGTVVLPPFRTRGNAGWPAFALFLSACIRVFTFLVSRRHLFARLAKERQAATRRRRDVVGYARYAISFISDLATPRSDVAKPSVNRL